MFATLLTIKEAFKGLIKNIWWNAVVLFLMVVSFLAFSVFYIANENINYITEKLNNEMVITVNLKENVKDAETILSRLKRNDDVDNVIFKSKEQVLSEVKEEMGEDASVLETFEGENIFPAQIIVTLNSPEQIKKIVADLNEEGFAEDVFYGERYIDNFLKFTEHLKKFGIIFAIIGIIVVVIVIIFVIKMNVEQRKEEIHIKSLIGANNYVMGMPFILEAVILGIIAYSVVFLGFNYAYGEILDLMQTSSVLVAKNAYVTEYAITLLVVILGVTLLGSIYSTARHMRKI